jgi:A/G-specific adenine glycosylase
MNSFDGQRSTFNGQPSIIFCTGRWTGAFDVDCEMVMPLKFIRAFHRSLRRWYRRNGRDLPWRFTRDPYAILVSELMLQQTQVATVLAYYSEWLRRFPNFGALSRAQESQVLHCWQGLGYYARARNLHATAKLVQRRYRGIFPRDIAEMRRLPGVGRYTANAVASFAFDQAVPVVEANITRVIARLFDHQQPIDSAAGQRRIWQNAFDLLPVGSSAAHNSALMDLGALICTPRKPKCGICPIRKFCRTTNPERLPIKRPRPRPVRLVETHLFVVRQGKILLQQSTKRWRGMWILPPLKHDGLKPSSSRRSPVHSLVFPFTCHRVTLRVFRQRRHKIANDWQRWFSIRSLNSIPIPSPHRRAITDLFSAAPPGQRRRQGSLGS